jgi:hypothetical protein
MSLFERVKWRIAFGRYYDPATEQFLSVDPLVDETGTPYAFTDGDPVNGSDPSGLDGCGANPFCYVGSGIDKLQNFGAEHSSGICNQVVGGLLGSVTGCDTAQTSANNCTKAKAALTYDEDMAQLKANYARDFNAISDALEEGSITPEQWYVTLRELGRQFRQGEQYYKQVYNRDVGDTDGGDADGGDLGGGFDAG